MLRLATYSDMDEILNIKNKAYLYHKDELKIDQWSEDYPNKEIFLKDIEQEELFVYEENGKILGFACLNYGPWDNYDSLNWNSEDKFLTIHRVAVDTDFKGKGIASMLLTELEDIAKSLGCNYLKIDTYSLNEPMNYLIKKLGYKFVGSMKPYEDKEEWNCYDKML